MNTRTPLTPTTMQRYEDQAIEIELKLYDIQDQHNLNELQALHVLVSTYKIDETVLFSVFSNELKLKINLIRYPSERLTTKERNVIVSQTITDAVDSGDNIIETLSDLVIEHSIPNTVLLSFIGQANRKRLKMLF